MCHHKEPEKKANAIQDSEKDFYACSACDCTGLIPALPEDEAELEAYEEIYPYIQKPIEK